MIVAIDGPAGAGKSSVARAVARVLGISFVDTGAMYRAVALAALEQGISPADGPSLGELAESLDLHVDGERVTLDGRDVTLRIRDGDVTETVSTVAAHREVRGAMVTLQRRLAAQGDAVVEGRDIGSTVLPEAEVKVFLTASPAERARRRVRQQKKDPGTLAQVEAEITARDAADASRAESPLVRADDAVELDTTDMSFDEVVGAVVRLVEERA